ncbi:MAG: flagellar assembly protein FliW [Proteobacteria bacterium]|nr:flagellar assembly protein FliW [Pseudomonadota bacterium]MBU1581171.1 flagellar assembly protein FliW [Pseudomonadota bacterium]MBU2454586.1 flagellar assembly protein FliW [Pseudomonadota bacterium]MBU2628391.1 flagellar assembly protein FliW [Pseudomonadota bacterium]
MKINTRQFGEIEIDEHKIINIPLGIPGFRDKKKYVLLQKEETVPFLVFQCMDDSDLSFVVLDPVKIIPEYTIEKKDIEKTVSWDLDRDEISCFVIVTIPNGKPEKMTANFMAPLVINNKKKEGLQLILQNSSYSHQYQLLK